MKVKLGVADRLQMTIIFPSQDDYLGLLMREEIIGKVKITQEEIEKWDMKSKGNDGVVWDGDKAEDVEVEFSNVELEYIRKHLEKMNNEKKLSAENYLLYKIFVVDKKDKK